MARKSTGPKSRTPGKTEPDPSKKRKSNGSTGVANKKKVKKTSKKEKVDPIQALLKKHSYLSKVSTEFGDKIRCTITNHEMPIKLELVEKHIASKKLKQAKEEWYSGDWVEDYLPFIVPHKTDKHRMYCILSKRAINRIPEEIKKHCEGRKFLKLKKLAEERRAKKESKQESGESDSADEDSGSESGEGSEE
mmetsp:Transcript_9173/g.17322  ORF Transcript_9173/g.17322 Transcript_9173/m.17322 type:complete len:192 (+) Transcript_9173:204-779(+)